MKICFIKNVFAKGEIKIKNGIELSDLIIEAIEMGLEITAVKK